MKIRLRLILLLGCLLAVFAAAVWLLHTFQRREAGLIRAGLEEQRNGLLDQVLTLTGQSLQGFANDYSLWGEMVTFVQTGDRAWAKVNLDASLVNFGVHAAWVLRPDGSVVYRTPEVDPATLAALTFAEPAFHERLGREKTMHFFLEVPAGLLEVRTAPIQPSDDTQRLTPARGWLVVTRLWDESYLQTLAQTLESKVTFASGPPRAGGASTINLRRELLDWNKRLVRTLQVNYRSLALTRLLEGNREEVYLLFFFGVAMITVTVIGVSRWVITPLRQLGQSLATGRTEPLKPLRQDQSEFGHLARQVEHSFAQRQALEHEVRERGRMAQALRETETHLRQSLELRSRLARDLHDGIIQSIYAAGLGLEGVRSMLQVDPASAEQGLASCQKALNETIWGVRTFIDGLEPELTQARPFRQTLTTLVDTMRSVQQANITLAIDESIARRVSHAQELQLLQILRESIANALRHGAPGSINLSLQSDTDGRARLEIADDGRGFNPAGHQSPGHGLVNLGVRAREMDGALQIDSAPGKGTRIIVRFNPSHPPTP